MVDVVGFDEHGNSAADSDAEAAQGIDFSWIVRQQAYRLNAKISEDLSSGTVCARIHGESKVLVRFYSIEPSILQSVCSNLVQQPDSAAFLTEINENASPFSLKKPQRRFELLATVTTQGTEDFTCETFRMNPDRDVVAVLYISFIDNHVLDAIFVRGDANTENAMFGGKKRLG
jgi:hypothetical protein